MSVPDTGSILQKGLHGDDMDGDMRLPQSPPHGIGFTFKWPIPLFKWPFPLVYIMSIIGQIGLWPLVYPWAIDHGPWATYRAICISGGRSM